MPSDVELKAGHAPAMKVGGMRVPHRDRPSESESTPTSDTPTPLGETKSMEMQAAQNALEKSGTGGLANKEIHTEEVRSYHNKPVVQHPNKAAFANTPNHSDNMPFIQPQRHNH